PRPASVMGGVILAVILAAVFLAPWLVAIERRIPGYTLRTLGAEIVDRSRRPMEGHNGPPGYYAMTIWGTYFPWSLLLPLAVVYAWRNRHVPQVRFALGAVVGPWVMFELVQTKLTHYLLPVYPFLAFLTADALIRCIRRGKGDLYDATWVKVTAGWALLVAALGLAPWAVLRAWPSRDPWLIAGLVSFSVTGLAYGWFVYSRFRQRRVAGAATAMGLGMLVVVIVGYAWVLPRLEFMRLSQRVADDLRRLGATAAGDVVMIDYKEPSLAFYLGGTIREAPEGYLSSLPPERWPMYVVLTAEVWRTTPSGVRERLDVLAAHRGLAYADGGRVVDVMVLRRRP
ncbi:MAG: hypothetical protein ACREIT_06350, partial [Tepidisphaeraceae bacterium]